ncbi:CNNM domain-containing protein [Halomonas sp. McH1-25]|uniref:CNNM domain-containing protein n=1 Tax=unclassified Halomonas TaxID=2609666 RepID=UPI001EF625D5|nr:MULTISPECIES: CNNM domain-containing protein [unclassified Halomonas]MCG7600121.1 CNNM domain-containing protein [Halomonas sp. McH1-25]MCP1341370.1 CNNM domain-containing protein [Halomonas sp. FL8]MCP1359685.1 CNNM domain-containing protein [Halomonas sp. BBD45]MCP1364263.1 CNNM domain-containing protein [Halomonas sp. BBD48]
MLLLALFAILSISVSFLCSILEASLLSLTPSYIAQQRDDRPDLHAKLFKLKGNIDQPLAAILTLNTVAHTVGATGVGAQVTVVFGEAYLGIASAIMTLLILVASEIIPKTLGATYWRQLSPLLPPLLGSMVWLLKPFIWLSERITNRLGSNEANVDMRGEIKALAQIGLEEKALDADETRSITNILNLHTMQIRDIMTPRTVSVTVNPVMTVAEFDKELGKSPFTRFPVMDGAEHALGYIHKADTYHAADDATLKSLMHPVNSLNGDDNVEQVFSLMLRERHHMCVVYDELGTWLGVVTLEDIIEAILGHDIVDETDNVSNLRKYAKQRWVKRIKKTT